MIRTICTENYEFSHGKKPRGTGMWAFDFGRRGAWTTEFAPRTMSYSEACKWAKAFAKQLGADRVSVGS